MPTHKRHAGIGLPAAVLGVIAGSVVGAPADAATADPIPLPAETAPLRLPAVDQRPAPAAAVPTAVAPATYTVQPGDTVSAVAARFGLNTADVLAWNDLGWRSVIYPGHTLSLVAPPAESTPVAEATSASASAATHTVVAGDTIFRIAQQQGASVDGILAANGLTGDSIIYPGQTLSIPGAGASAAPAPDPAPASPPAATNDALNAPQAENAALIISIGRELGVPDRGIAIALGTSMVESWLRNLDWGDRDSLGLFQQRPSTGWGTPEQIRDRQHSIRAFFGGPHDPNGTTTRGLLDIPGWESMSFTEAAQAVQISAHPDRYAKWEGAAYTWLALYG